MLGAHPAHRAFGIFQCSRQRRFLNEPILNGRCDPTPRRQLPDMSEMHEWMPAYKTTAMNKYNPGLTFRSVGAAVDIEEQLPVTTTTVYHVLLENSASRRIASELVIDQALGSFRIRHVSTNLLKKIIFIDRQNLWFFCGK
jgi:hypothetical protein